MSQHAGYGGLDLGHWVVSSTSRQSGKSSVGSSTLLSSGSRSATASKPLASVEEELLNMLAAGGRFGQA